MFFEPVFGPIALALDDDGFSVVQEAIQDGGGDGRVVVEDAWPVLVGLIGGNDCRALLVAAADDLEQQIRAGFVDGKISQFVQLC